MAVCYINKDYDNRYDCEYEFKDNVVEVVVDYEIMDEVEAVNGIKSFGSQTEFISRDILINHYIKFYQNL